MKLGKRIFRGFLKLGLLAVLALTLFVSSVYLGFWGPLPDAEELAGLQKSRASLVYAQKGELIGSYYSINRDPVSYQELPEHLLEALVATEDERFYEHAGIDWRSLLRVAFKSVLMGDASAGGGSTLTQQLVKNLFGRPDYGLLSLPVNKTREILLAYRLESAFSKQELLALYFNTVSFSENTYGIAAGARRFFNCQPADLKMEEAAVLVGLLKANTYYNPRLNPDWSLKRRNVVFAQMQRNGYLNEAEYDSLSALPLELDYRNLDIEGPAPYFLAQVEKELAQVLKGKVKADGSPWDPKKDGLRIYTTLDARKQANLRRSYRRHLAQWQKKFDAHWSRQDPWSAKPSFFDKKLQATPQYQQLAARSWSDEKILSTLSKERNMELFHPAGMVEGAYSMQDSLRHYLRLLRGASMLLNPKSGAIEAWIGGPDYRYLPYDALQAPHSMASTVKPFTMAAALEAGAQPCDYLSAERREYPEHQNWSPRNYDAQYDGLYSMAGALKKSINTVTVAWFFKVGEHKVKELADDLGLAENWPDGPTAALGTAAVRPIDLAQAYAVFANGGEKVSAYFIEKIETAEGDLLYHREAAPRERIISSETSQLINTMLQGVSAEGTARSLSSVYGSKYPWAAKTGTAQNYSDAWFVAYRPDVVSVTWMGGVSPLIHFRSGAYGSGSTMALPVFGYSLKELEKTSPAWPKLDESLVSKLDCPDYREENLLDGIRSLFENEAGEKVKTKEDTAEGGSPWWKRIFKKKD